MFKPKVKDDTPATTKDLIDALKFVSIIQKDTGLDYTRHVRIENNMVIGTDGIITIAHPIAEDLNAYPQTALFISALQKCNTSHTITQLDNSRIAIKAGVFKGYVPCLTQNEIPIVTPDFPCATINDSLRDCMGKIEFLANEESDILVVSSLLIREGTIISTDRHLILQAWHGIDLPEIALTKRTVKTILKIKKPLIQFGFTSSSATFYFEGGAWLKARLPAGGWPDLPMLDEKSNAWPLPPDFFTALRAIEPFADDNNAVIFSKNMVHTHNEEFKNIGASYEVNGLAPGGKFGIRKLLSLEPFVKTIDFGGVTRRAYFFGDNIRGVLAGIGDAT